MYCSKCGQQIADDAVFCQKCGTAVSSSGVTNTSVNDNKRSASVMSPDEKEKKIRAIAVFCISALLSLGLLWYVIATKAQCLAFVFEGPSPSWTIESALEYMWDEIGFLIVFFGFVLTVSELGSAFNMYIMPCIKRNFSQMKKAVVGGSIIEVFGLIVAAVIITVKIGDELDSFDPFFLYSIIFILSFVRVFVAIAYSRAANAEEVAKYHETKGSSISSISKLNGIANSGNNSDKWICDFCGSPNDKLSGQCKDCGKYK